MCGKIYVGCGGHNLHVNVNIYLSIVSFEVDSAVEFAFLVDSDIIVVFDGIDEVIGIVFREVFDTKVVYIYGEGVFACLVVPDVWCVLHGVIPIGGDFIDELFECDDSGLFEAAHSAADFKLDMSTSFNVEVVFFY